MDSINEIITKLEDLEISKWTDEDLHIVIDAALAGNHKAAEIIFDTYESNTPFDDDVSFWTLRNFTEKEEKNIREVLELYPEYREENEKQLAEFIKQREQFLKKLMDYVMQSKTLDDSRMKELIRGNEIYMSKFSITSAFHTWVDEHLFPEMTAKLDKYTSADEEWELCPDLPF